MVKRIQTLLTLTLSTPTRLALAIDESTKTLAPNGVTSVADIIQKHNVMSSSILPTNSNNNYCKLSLILWF